MEKVLQGGVYIWGMGSNNYLGNAKKQDEHLPFFIKELKNHKCLQVATGTFYTLVRTEAGEVFAWGVNSKNRFAENLQ
jgi:alpha-tubulin suppressor-like RCC1 family protein